MSAIRDDFPATSIGRTGGHRLQTSSSGLETHPLLLPRPASPAPSDHGSITGGTSLNNNVHPRYLPYTPRQRVTPTAATTGTTVHPSSPQHQAGDATSKLQLMHLKAAAQMIGLDSGTLGWAMLERLVLDAEVGDEWTEVWNAITSGKVRFDLLWFSIRVMNITAGNFVVTFRSIVCERKNHSRIYEGPHRPL